MKDLNKGNKKNYWDCLITQFIAQNFKNENNINGLFKCADKLCKIYKIYVNEYSSFTCSNGINWEICSKITCSTVIVSYPPKSRKVSGL